MSAHDDQLIEQARRWAEQAGPDADATVAVTRPPQSRPSIPAEIGPIRLIREIGRGGMGVVYLGRDQMLGRDVAVKLLLDVVAGPDDPGFVRFLEGARAAARVRHPGLTTLYQADMVAGVPYLVMEYIDGPTLGAILRQSERLSVAAGLAAAGAVAEAVAALHEREIVHRDIKPRNVLLDRAGAVYVTDFGLACARPGRGAQAGVAGTLPYMAPEMFEGEVSPRSDVYALGITTYELLTGELPFTGPPAEMREKHRSEALPIDPLVACGVDPAIIAVLERAAHKNPTFRYKTAAHVLRALREVVPDARIWARGAAELASEAARHRQSPVSELATDSKTPSSTSYYEHLASIAATKRERQSGSVPDGVVLPLALAKPPSDPSSGGRRKRDILTLQKCPRCEYSLEGLPRRYRCPECGFEYDESMFVIYGWSRNSHRPDLFRATVGTASPILGVIIVSVLFFAIAASAIRGSWKTVIVFGPGLAAGIAQWLWRRRARRRHGGSVQFAFSSRGASRRRAPGQPEFIPWSEFRRITFRRAGRDAWRLRLARGGWQLRIQRSMTRTLTGRPWIEGVTECSRREAATLGGEIRRRLRAANT